ncbi:RHS repeat-associated core domain-containing protein [Porticoccus sp. W117]|nr:RHS repeat-associated core domain-containing protein [Porticoccus sp. W117]
MKKQLSIAVTASMLALGLSSISHASQTWNYTYNSNGQVLTKDGPRTDVSDVTTYTYDASGNLSTITNALGHVTQLTDYNGRGQPEKTIDSNGVETLFTYHARGWLLTSTLKDPGGNSANDAVTTYGYDNVGQITSITLANGAVMNYEYDGARRLTAVSNNLGERIEYTVDLAGNVTQEVIKDGGSTIVKSMTQTYDELSRLLTSVGASNQTTSYGYDVNGNVTSITDGNNNQTTQSFDALDRLKDELKPLNQDISYGYDAQGNMNTVTDPKGLVTTYNYNGLGNLTSLVSPDTGTTSYTHDEADNRLTKTDAKGVTASYSYDALNRLTAVDYPGTTLDITYGYDAGAYGKGRLTSITDASGTRTFTYDYFGNLASISATGSASYTLSYGYTTAGQLNKITYPSGRTVDYTYNNQGEVNGATTTYNAQTQTLASNFTYQPFGPIKQFDYGNGIQLDRSFDQDYRLTSQSHGTVKANSYSYDNVDNITAVDDTLDGSRDQSFTYDALDRLTNATGVYGTLSYTYDATGNRQTITDNTGTDSYTYDANSHRLLSTNNWTYQYDANGNQVSKLDSSGNGLLYGYDDRNRLVTVTERDTSANPNPQDTLKATYTYNARGERVKKVTPTATTHYLYTSAGELLAELDGSGAAVREYIYLAKQPLAIAQYSAPSSSTLYYSHNDHLGTPQVITNGIQQVVWSSDRKPFGETTVTTTTIANNLRFTGQHYDEESGLHHNYFRDYDPETGRYIQSDPIGLGGGISTYGYVSGNPVKYTDPLGLFVDSVTATCRVNPAFCRAVGLLGGASVVGQVAVQNVNQSASCPPGFGSSTFPDFSSSSSSPWSQANESSDGESGAKQTPVPNAAASSPANSSPPDPEEDPDDNEGEDGDTEHGKQRKQEGRSDPNRSGSAVDRVIREGKRYTDTETGNTVYVKGNQVVILRPNGQFHTRFKNPRSNTLNRIRSGRWQ